MALPSVPPSVRWAVLAGWLGRRWGGLLRWLGCLWSGWAGLAVTGTSIPGLIGQGDRVANKAVAHGLKGPEIIGP